MKNKHVGILIIAVAVLFLIIVLSFNNALDSIVNTSCTHGQTCPMQTTVKTQKMISYGIISLLMIIGLLVSLFMKDEQTTIIKHENNHNNPNDKLTLEEREQKLNELNEEEQTIMNIVLREEGSVYQSDLMKETSFSKVKITRILDRLEGKGLIERKRRGMTNIVILR